MGGTFSSRGAGDDAGTESSQPTTNGTVVELQAAVAATSASGAMALRDEIERGVLSMWSNSDGDRSKRLAGAVVKCKPGFSPAWYFVPTSRPVVAHGLRVAVNPAFERCIVLSQQDLEERVECLFLGVLADPATRPPHGLDPAAVRHTWLGSTGPIQVAVYGTFGPASGQESVGAPMLELAHGELDSLFRPDLQAVLGELGFHSVPWIHPDSPSRADVRVGVVSAARLSWVALPLSQLGVQSVLEVTLHTLFKDCPDSLGMALKPGFVRVGVLSDFVAGFISAQAVDIHALVIGIHTAEVERIKAAEGYGLDLPPPSVGSVIARLMEQPGHALLLAQAAGSVAAHQAAHPEVALGRQGFFVNAGTGLAVALAAQQRARLSQSFTLVAPHAASSLRASPSASFLQPPASDVSSREPPVSGTPPYITGTPHTAHQAEQRLPAGPVAPPVLHQAEQRLPAGPVAPPVLQRPPAVHAEAHHSSIAARLRMDVIAERRRLRALELQQEEEELQALTSKIHDTLVPDGHLVQAATQAQTIAHLRAELEAARKPMNDAEVLVRAQQLQAHLAAWPTPVGGSQATGGTTHLPPAHPQPSLPRGFPPGFPHHAGSTHPLPSTPFHASPPPPPAHSSYLPGSAPPHHAPSPAAGRRDLFAPFIPRSLITLGALDPRQILTALAAAAARAGATGGELGLVTFLANLNGHRDLALNQRPLGSTRCATLAAGDLEALLTEIVDMIALGPSVAGGSPTSLAALQNTMDMQPEDWDAAYLKLDECLAAVQQQRCFRTSRNIQLGSYHHSPPGYPPLGGAGGGAGGGGGDGHAAGILGHAVAVFHTDSALANRSTPSATMVQPLATSAVVMAEASAISVGHTLGEVHRQITTYGQRAFAFLFGMGKVHGGRVSGGLPARLVESNASLPLHARSLIIGVVGVGFDVGQMALVIDSLAGYIHVMDWETGVTDGTGGLLHYPRLEVCVQVLGGDPSTAEFATTQRGRSGGAAGSVSDPSHIKQAARHLEHIMVQLHHYGGGAAVNSLGNFGIAAYVERCVSMLDLPRALHLFGTLMMKLHRAADLARCIFNPALKPGDPTLDIVGTVRDLEARALPVHEARQLSDESVDARLTHLGVNAAAMQRTASAAVTAAVSPAVDKALKASRWGPPILHTPPPPPAALSSTPLGGGVDPNAWLDQRMDWLAPVRALEEALVGTASAGACPWYSLFSDCRKAKADKCLACPGGVLATQAMVDKVKLVTVGPVHAKITGVPSVPNPTPGTGKENKRKRGL